MEWWQAILVGGSIIVIATGLLKAGSWKGSVDTDRDAFKAFMGEIRTDIKKLSEKLTLVVGMASIDEKLFSHQSPTHLTDYGKEVSKKLDADKWAVETARKLAADATGKTPYEIEEMSFAYARDQLMLDKGTKTKAYEESLDRDNITLIFGLELRDAILEEIKKQK